MIFCIQNLNKFERQNMNAVKDGIPEHSSSCVKLESFHDRLAVLAEKAGGWSSLARKAGLSKGGMSRYKNGGEPTRPALVAIANAAEVSIEWLATGSGPTSSSAAVRAK